MGNTMRDKIHEMLGIKVVEVGTISEELRKEFVEMDKQQDLLGIDYKMDKLKIRRALVLGEITEEEVCLGKQTAKEKAEATAAALDTTHEKLWNRVYEELGIEDTDRGYDIGLDTGIVSTRERIGNNVH